MNKYDELQYTISQCVISARSRCMQQLMPLTPIQKNLVIGSPTDILLFECPHCLGEVQVMRSEINCSIFRHGILKGSGQQISPHASKADCDALIASDAIFGCGGPFRLMPGTEYWTIEICEYI